MKQDTNSSLKVAVIGGGPVGALTALLLGQRGWSVDLFERRSDPRTTPLQPGKSINLALSRRGIAALEAAGVASIVLEEALPMKGRMIHGANGLSQQPYGVYGECIYAIDRKRIADTLLDAAEKLPNVSLTFDAIVTSVDLEKPCLSLQDEEEELHYDLIVAADGAYSKVRQQLMRQTRMCYDQQYIDHAWCELNIPPTSSGEHAIDKEHLHIWPRHSFMMIALPNTDGSFTSTLFMPFAQFDAIQTEEELMSFFESTFPDAIPLMGKENIIKNFFNNPKGSLISIKCRPYHYKHTTVILGDAAHAMVPFYGQGMNCGFEDALVLTDIFNQIFNKEVHPSNDQMAQALSTYTETRHPDVTAMCDLALHNYVEMRSSVLNWSYLIRKNVEGFLHRLFPKSVIPLYTMVSFTQIPYHRAMQQWKKQTSWLKTVSYTLFSVSTSMVIKYGLLKPLKKLKWGSA